MLEEIYVLVGVITAMLYFMLRKKKGVVIELQPLQPPSSSEDEDLLMVEPMKIDTYEDNDNDNMSVDSETSSSNYIIKDHFE